MSWVLLRHALAFACLTPARVLGPDAPFPQSTSAPSGISAEQTLRAAIEDNRIAYRLSRPAELIALLGPPTDHSSHTAGSHEQRVLSWPQIRATFDRPRPSVDFLLVGLEFSPADDPDNFHELDTGRTRTLVLRNLEDLDAIDKQFGLFGASLARLDLRDQLLTLRGLNFDSNTVWPPAAHLPNGFFPRKLLEDGMNPGLGVRKLHRAGIDGRGIHVAIIDQPLLVDHGEYIGQIERYEAVSTPPDPAQMHGTAVASILVGRRLGVAPGARLSFYAVPMWQSDCAPLADALERILDRNAAAPQRDRVRIVSISTAMFPQWPHRSRWLAACERASKEGVWVLTCEQSADFSYGMFNRRSGDPDDPASYRRGRDLIAKSSLGVPAGGRTTASELGPDVYTYWARAGKSWCTPYLAGVIALGFQVDPDLTPQRARQLLITTAHHTRAGLLLNPPAFVEAVRAARASAPAQP